MYDGLIFVIGHLGEVCGPFPAPTAPWAAVFISDWLRDITTNAEFLEWMGHIGPRYAEIAQCTIENIGKH